MIELSNKLQQNKNIKKIAVIHPTMSYHGGAEFVINRLCEELSTLGFKVTLFTDEFDHDFFGTNKNFEIETFNLGEYHVKIKKWKKIGKLISKKLEDFDLINVHNSPAYFYYYFAKQNNDKIVAPVVWYCHEPDRAIHNKKVYNTNVKSKENRILKILREIKQFGLLYHFKYFKNYNYIIKNEKQIINDLDLILCNSNYVSNMIKKLYNITPITCYLGYIGKLSKTNNYEKYLFTVSRIIKEKNIRSIISAVENLYNKNKLNGYKYVIAGKGNQFDELSKYVRDKNLEHVIIFKGFIDEKEKHDLYSNSSFTIHLPIDESFGLVCLESFAYKKPIITSNYGGPSEIIDNDIDGILVKPDDVKEIEKAIEKLITNQKNSHKMGEMGYKKVENNFLFTPHFIKRFLTCLSDIKK